MRSFVTLMLLALLISCGSDVAGTGSQAGNGIVAGVAVLDTTAVAGVTVWLREGDFLADTTGDSTEHYETVTDDSGAFRFDSVPLGEYVVEIRRDDSTLASRRFVVDSLYDAGIIPIETSGSYFGTVDTTIVPLGQHFHARIYGLNVRAEVSLFGEFYFPNLPAGEQILHLLSNDPQIGLIALDTILIIAGTADTSGTPYQLPGSWARDSIVVQSILNANSVSGVTVKDVTTLNSEGRVEELILDNLGIVSLPPAFVHLEISKLVIINNPLFVNLPLGIEKILTLIHLDLTHNGLIGLPVTLADMHNLTYLSVDGNNLLGGQQPPPIEIIQWLDTYSTNPNWRDTQGP